MLMIPREVGIGPWRGELWTNRITEQIRKKGVPWRGGPGLKLLLLHPGSDALTVQTRSASPSFTLLVWKGGLITFNKSNMG